MIRRSLEYGLFLTGLVLVGLFAHSYLRYQAFQKQDLSRKQFSLAAAQQSGKSVAPAHPVVGRLSIERLGFSVAMVEGDDEESLELAAGHMSGTAFPGQTGNMIIAGHRDSAFWPLRDIQKGDRVRVEDLSKAVYRVEETRIVTPTDLTLLADTRDSVLTLVTCYPFRHVGPAPQRFIVRARLIS